MFFLAVIVPALPLSAADWKQQDSGTLAWFHAIQFVNSAVGFAAGSNGTLLVTKDGGRGWSKIILRNKDTIRDLHFLNESTGFLLFDSPQVRSDKVNSGSYIKATTDGGYTWSEIGFQSRERFRRLLFNDSSMGYLTGEGGVFVRVPTSQIEERRFSLPVRFLMTDGIFLSDRRTVLVGGGGTIVYTDDDGISWKTARFVGTRPETKINAVHFVDGLNGWAAGNAGTIFSTRDAGKTWRKCISGTSLDLLDIRFIDKLSGYAVGENGIVLRTEDSGENWISEKSGTKHRLERLAVAGKRVLAVGFGGTIISTELNN